MDKELENTTDSFDLLGISGRQDDAVGKDVLAVALAKFEFDLSGFIDQGSRRSP
jgi:hypothetical protein